MFPNSFSILFGIASLLSLLCDARVFDHNVLRRFPNYAGELLTPPSLGPIFDGESYASFDKRQTVDDGSDIECRSKCGPVSCSATSCTPGIKKKRTLYGVFDFDNATVTEDYSTGHYLVKRVLEQVDQGDIGTYLDDQSGAPDIVTLIPAEAGGVEKPTYCKMYEFKNIPLNANGQFLMGSANTLLEGCTIMAVLSSRGVYMCHIFEDLNFGSNPNPPGVRPLEGLNPLIDLIKGEPNTKSAKGDAFDFEIFNQIGDETTVYFMTPRPFKNPNRDDKQAYSNEISQLTDLMQQFIPEIGVAYYNYHAKKKYAEAFQGVALFEYDKNADGKGNADWRLWFEQTSRTGRSTNQNPPGS